MRLWSIHPKYLDAKGLVALWREALLAKNVILGNTKGYKHHPQLHRFKSSPDPEAAIDHYLASIFEEATTRNYQFDKSKFFNPHSNLRLQVTKGQLDFERDHLLRKLKVRDLQKYTKLKGEDIPDAHPIFTIIDGGVERWEILPE